MAIVSIWAALPQLLSVNLLVKILQVKQLTLLDCKFCCQ